MNADANPGAVTRHKQENICPCQKIKITVISGFRTKIAVVAKYRTEITVHCRGFWLPYKYYCGDQLPCNNYRTLSWWLATAQCIPWLPITVMTGAGAGARRLSNWHRFIVGIAVSAVIVGTTAVGAIPRLS